MARSQQSEAVTSKQVQSSTGETVHVISRKRRRDVSKAGRGRYVSEQFAAANPDITSTEIDKMFDVKKAAANFIDADSEVVRRALKRSSRETTKKLLEAFGKFLTK